MKNTLPSSHFPIQIIRDAKSQCSNEYRGLDLGRENNLTRFLEPIAFYIKSLYNNYGGAYA
jgi:hypothetical protein